MLLENTLYSNTDKVFMNTETDARNMSNLASITKHWYLDHDSWVKVVLGINEPPSICGSIPLGIDHRAWHKIDLNEQTDVNYSEYKRVLNYHRNTLEDKLLMSTIQELKRYNTWKTAKIAGMKLFKYMLNLGISEHDVERLTTSRNTSQMYLCISKNPIDFLFMSTNQPFTSCMSLQSSYSAAFYMGMPEIWVDPFKYIMFITPGKLRTQIVKGQEFKHFKYIQRTLAISDGKTIGLCRDYPHRVVDIPTIAPKSWHINEHTNDYQDYVVEGLRTPPLRFEDGEHCVAYNDTYILRYGYSLNHSSGSPIDMNWSDGFEHMDGLPDKINTTCYCCEYRINREDDRYTLHNGSIICEGCYNDNYVTCESCGEIYHYDDTDSDDYAHFCESCMDTKTRCSSCGQIYDEDNMTYNNDGEPYCESCKNEHLTQCDDCCGYYDISDTYTIEYKTLCSTCLNDYKN